MVVLFKILGKTFLITSYLKGVFFACFGKSLLEVFVYVSRKSLLKLPEKCGFKVQSIFAVKKSPLAVWFLQGKHPKLYLLYYEWCLTQQKPIYARKNN